MSTKSDLCQQDAACSVYEEEEDEMDNDYWYDCFHRFIQAWDVPFGEGQPGDPPVLVWDSYNRIIEDGDPGAVAIAIGLNDMMQHSTSRDILVAWLKKAPTNDLRRIVIDYDEFLDQPDIGHEPGDDAFLDLVATILMSREGYEHGCLA